MAKGRGRGGTGVWESFGGWGWVRLRRWGLLSGSERRVEGGERCGFALKVPHVMQNSPMFSNNHVCLQSVSEVHILAIGLETGRL